jgi:diaminohydroxyphosphoribosylaminopyrimidine deaminase/5-amino-6-(5-phosphoribosylamino)uracil reductase
VIAAGIRRVVVAVQDPNPLVAGRGLSLLREHGLEVVLGTLGSEAAQQNAPFFTVMQCRRPFVTMKVALSRDGYVAARKGVRTQLTGAPANRFIHRERAEVDAIGVGSGTLLADDPRLTARGAYRSRPLVRVVFDRRLRTPPSARLLSTMGAGPIIIVGAEPRTEAGRQRSQALEAAGASLLVVPERESSRFLQSSLAALTARGVMSLVLEGGPGLHAAAWSAGVVDRVQVFRTPALLGADGVPWLEAGARLVDGLDRRTTLAMGDDVKIEGYVHRTG